MEDDVENGIQEELRLEAEQLQVEAVIIAIGMGLGLEFGLGLGLVTAPYTHTHSGTFSRSIANRTHPFLLIINYTHCYIIFFLHTMPQPPQPYR